MKEQRLECALKGEEEFQTHKYLLKGTNPLDLPFDSRSRLEEHSKYLSELKCTQMAFEINFYFCKFNMMWILG